MDEQLKTLLKPVRRHPRRATAATILFILGLSALVWRPQPLHSDNFIFYLPTAHDVIPIQTYGGTGYLPLLHILNLVGKVDALRESSKRLRVWYGDILLDVRAGKRKVTLNKASLNLPDPVRLEDGQWLVPLDFLNVVLPRLVKEPIIYRAGDDRIFIGSTKPSTFTVHLGQLPNGARIKIEFTSPLTIQTAAHDGKWILYLGERAIEPLEQKFQFDSPYVSDLQFDDQDGTPKLILTPKISGLDFVPTLEQGGEVVTADVTKPAPSPAEQAVGGTAPAGPAATSQSGQATGGAPSAASPANSTLPLVVLDAGHGGADIGAQGPNGVLEKNLVAQYAARIRGALQATGKYRVLLTRVGDTDPDFTQRETLADTLHVAAFISLHAGNLGFRTPRLAIYTYQPSEPPTLAPDAPRPLWVPWDEAQTLHLDQSKLLAQALQDAWSHFDSLLAGQVQAAPVRVLRSVDAPAIAIEAGSLSPNMDPTPLLTPDFQQKIANGIVTALDSFTRRPL